jgi:dTDP-4-amino-4,6-dideoxygalactose transaminase
MERPQAHQIHRDTLATLHELSALIDELIRGYFAFSRNSEFDLARATNHEIALAPRGRRIAQLRCYSPQGTSANVPVIKKGKQMHFRRAGRLLSLPTRAVLEATRTPLYSFIQGPPSGEGIANARSLMSFPRFEDVQNFEDSFASLVGEGRAISYASGRMAFFSLLKTLGISDGDEVILPGFTCSVMVNAVLRAGAKPVFSDIAASTFGSDPRSIYALVTRKTRVIVAQHSFGYPCDIQSIVEIAERSGVFLVEDCATSLGTTLDGKVIGDFGNAAIFSTDHTKPINTLIGGLLYSRDEQLVARLRRDHGHLDELPRAKQEAVWHRLQLEGVYRAPNRQGKLAARDVLAGPTNRIFRATTPFLDDDYLPSSVSGTYPYPALLPPFLANLGLEQTKRWSEIQLERRSVLGALLEVLQNSPSGVHLPEVLFDQSATITPLRLAWADPNADAIKRRMRRFLTTEGTWFLSPIVATAASAEDFGYRWGSCPTAESRGPNMVNIPAVVSRADLPRLIELVALSLRAG